MGRNRKWVLEDNLSQAVWRTILRGPVHHLVHGNGEQDNRRILHPPQQRAQEGSIRKSTSNKIGRESLGPGNSGVAQPPQRLSPDERVSEARARVPRLEAALQVLGEDSPEGLPIKEALKKARDQSRSLPIGERLDSTLKFVQRSRARIEKIQDLTREQHLLQ